MIDIDLSNFWAAIQPNLLWWMLGIGIFITIIILILLLLNSKWSSDIVWKAMIFLLKFILGPIALAIFLYYLNTKGTI